MTEPDRAETVTLICDVCDEPIERHASGKQSAARMAALHLGLHKRNAHGVKGTGKAAKAREAEELAGEHGTVRQIAAGVTDAVSEARKSRSAPKTDELAGVFGRLATLASTLAASMLVESDPAFTELSGPEVDTARQQTLDALILDGPRARKIMHPLARLAEPTALNKRYGRRVVDNADALNSAAELGLYAWTVRAYLRDRAARIDARADRAAAEPEYPPAYPTAPYPTAPLPEPGTNGAGPPNAADNGWTGTPPPTRGVVVTPDMLRHPGPPT